MRRTLAALPVLLACAAAAADPGFVQLDITASPIDRFTLAEPQTAYGTIEYRGGLSLNSTNPHFGGLSGLEITREGELIAIADTGFWLTARLIEDGGRLTGLADIRMAPMLDADGQEANRKSSADAEGLRLAADGRSVLVSFEQDHRVSRFALGDLAYAIPVPVDLPPLAGLAGNRGIEAVAVAPAEGPLGTGSTVIFAERSRDSAGNVRAWVLDGPRAGMFSVRSQGQFDITDAAFLPNGDLFILERLFSLSAGIAMRVRRLAAADIRPGATVDGPVILFDDHLSQIDNMEGMALTPLASGEVLMTLVSDDNHSLLQRTLILQFLWRETIPPLPPARP